MFSELLKIVSLILVSLGGGGSIVLLLSGWLGKVWADRLMQQERVLTERKIEDFKSQAVRVLEQEKASYQRELEGFKASITRENDLAAQTLRERLALYKDTLLPVLDLYMLFVTKQGKLVDLTEIHEFERRRLVHSVTLGMFAPVPVFVAYNVVIDYIQDSIEGKRPFDFGELRTLGFLFLDEVRKDLGVFTEELTYTGTRQ